MGSFNSGSYVFDDLGGGAGKLFKRGNDCVCFHVEFKSFFLGGWDDGFG